MKFRRRTIIYIIIAILCILYGISVARQGYGTSFFLVWILIAAIFGIMAVSAQKNIWKRLPVWFRRTILTVLGIGACVFVWVEALILSEINASGDDNLDYIIVLGAKINESGPSSILAARLNVALEYLDNNPDTKVIVSGGQGNNEPCSEAEGMRRYLVDKGIKEDRIIIESDSYTTEQNIRNSMALIGNNDAKVGIATSNFHVYRACKIAKKQGLTNVSGLAGNVVLFYMPQNMFREFFGIIKDTLAGNM